jgi:hypothetical protein
MNLPRHQRHMESPQKRPWLLLPPANLSLVLRFLKSIPFRLGAPRNNVPVDIPIWSSFLRWVVGGLLACGAYLRFPSVRCPAVRNRPNNSPSVFR